MYYGYNYLPKYGFGDWLGSKVGQAADWAGDKGKWVGFVPGLGSGLRAASELRKDGKWDFSAGNLIMAGGRMGSPGTTMISSDKIRKNAGMIPGPWGDLVQSEYEGDLAMQEQQQQMAEMQKQQAYQNRLSAANMQISGQSLPQNNMYSGTQNFANGGTINDKTVSSIYKTDTGKRFYPVRPTVDIVRDTANFFPITEGDNYPIYGTFNEELIDTLDPNLLVKERLTPKGKIAYSDQILRQLSENPPTEEYLRSRPQIKFPGLAYGGSLNRRANGGDLNNYSGQTHNGPNGGIPVDAQGNPTITNGEKPVALVEDGESQWTDPDSGEVYIFSNRLSRK